MRFNTHKTPFGAMNVYGDITQGSEQWEAVRRGRATASQFKKIITAVKMELSASAKKYMYSLLGDTIETDVAKSFVGNDWTERGQALEPKAREAFERLTGLELSLVGFVTRVERNSPVQIVGCSPDALVIDPVSKEFVAGFEGKAPSPAVHIETVDNGGVMFDRGGILEGSVIPNEHLQQVHGSLVVTGLPEWHFWSYCPGMKPFHVVVRRDAYTEKLSAAVDQFIIDLVAMRARCQKLKLDPQPE